MACKNAELKQAGYATLDVRTDPLLLSLAIREAADMRVEYPDMKVEKLYEFLLSEFPGEEGLKAKKARSGNLSSPNLWISWIVGTVIAGRPLQLYKGILNVLL